mmetsp:Transcript_16781/g.21659  ORF Transcript_16781/g.21659 Transcript_16781/m.21659 type:complete len:104 (+) Transcript_16781:2079-2390(+)
MSRQINSPALVPPSILPRRHRRIPGIVVKSAADFAADPAGFDIFYEQWAGAVFGVGEAVMQDLHDGETRVQADKVSECQRAHWVVRTKAHGGINAFNRADAFI